MAISTYQTYLMVKASSTYSKLIDIKSFPDLGGEPEMLETTTLSDPARTYIPGIKGGSGTMTFSANYTAADYDTVAALVGTEQDLAIWFGAGSDGTTPDGSAGKFEFKGYVDVYVNGGDVNAVVDMTISVAPTTEIKKAAGTP